MLAEPFNVSRRLQFALSGFLLLMSLSHAADAAVAQRVVTLAPNLTELVFAAGAGDRLVGADLYSDYPEAAKSIARIGDAFRVDSERVLALRPDLVLAWANGTPQTVIEHLQSLGLRVVALDVTHLAQVGDALRTIGKLTATEARAEPAAQSFEKRMRDLRKQYAGRPRLRVFIEVDRQPLFTVNGGHLISEVVSLCGGDNVFADLNQLAPSVGVEAVIAADPDVILATLKVAALQSEWSSWPRLKAVRERHLYALNADVVTRATPRVIQGAQQVCSDLDDARRRSTMPATQ